MLLVSTSSFSIQFLLAQLNFFCTVLLITLALFYQVFTPRREFRLFFVPPVLPARAEDPPLKLSLTNLAALYKDRVLLRPG